MFKKHVMKHACFKLATLVSPLSFPATNTNPPPAHRALKPTRDRSRPGLGWIEGLRLQDELAQVQASPISGAELPKRAE